ncbi:type I DNA topoisomerase [Paludisphaera borealis]|uniref:DNA topoisomerase 1 n=1 Tax=Paludisphaera borealis TaxID=1387353 RepID=A0A1U7CXM0_9BACT|nr:type I DNA topoisomerase [Paludisphaera borealis]APW63661.1 DNA topoisomerase 1 [Paludisphaera borealis]
MPRKSSSTTTPKNGKAAKPKTAKPAAPRSKAATGKGSRTKAAEGPPAGGYGPALVIVESPKKAKSINKFLGSKFIVKASMGHVRDLPKRKLGLDVADGYTASYEIVPAKKDTIGDLRRDAARSEIVYLATDPDREGEAIAWHLQQALDLPDDRVRRVTFHEITERAVREAFNKVGPINMDMVNAQQARRFLDRFVGYQLSPLLWSKVARNLSAGRVQSVAVRLIVDRERDIRAFIQEEFWKITAAVSPAGSTLENERFEAGLTEFEGAKFAAKTEAEAQKIRDVLASEPYVVSKVDETEKLDKADPPFKTSTLQQQAAIRLRFPGKKTMKVAQELYEGIDVDGSGPVGLITYMRTDSLRVSEEALTSVRDLIKTQYGDRYVPPKALRYSAGKNAQEAHEAIRPTELSLTPDKVQKHLSHDQNRLYAFIYWRFVASQMTAAVFTVTDVAITAGPGLFKAQGKILRFDGHRKIWPPGGKQEDALLPAVSVGGKLDLQSLDATQHFTQPPPRYSEATLIKALEKENIGRPSTYAPIIQTIQDRKYVEHTDRRFFATELGMVVTDVLVKHFPKILDLKFTAHMEDELDDVAQAKEDMVKVLDEFYYPFQEALKAAETQMERVQIATNEICHVCGAPMVMKFGRTGEFLGCSKYPECKATRPKDGPPRAEAVESGHVCAKCGKPLLIRENKKGEKFLSCSGYPECKESFDIDPEGNPVQKMVETEHKCEKCGKPLALRQGKRGPFLGCTGYPKCRNIVAVDVEGNPLPTIKIDKNCEKCGKPFAIRQGKRGAFLGCTGYPKCRNAVPVPDELKDEVAKMAPPPAAAAGPDLKSIQIDEICDDCGGPMIPRKGRRGYFLGCAKYPKCKGTKEPSEGTLEKINAVMANAADAAADAATT